MSLTKGVPHCHGPVLTKFHMYDCLLTRFIILSFRKIEATASTQAIIRFIVIYAQYYWPTSSHLLLLQLLFILVI